MPVTHEEEPPPPVVVLGTNKHAKEKHYRNEEWKQTADNGEMS